MTGGSNVAGRRWRIGCVQRWLLSLLCCLSGSEIKRDKTHIYFFCLKCSNEFPGSGASGYTQFTVNRREVKLHKIMYIDLGNLRHASNQGLFATL